MTSSREAGQQGVTSDMTGSSPETPRGLEEQSRDPPLFSSPPRSKFIALQREFLAYKQKVDSEISDTARDMVALQQRLVASNVQLAEAKAALDDLTWKKKDFRGPSISVPGGTIPASSSSSTPSSSNEESSTSGISMLSSWFGSNTKLRNFYCKCPACGWKVKLRPLKRTGDRYDGLMLFSSIQRSDEVTDESVINTLTESVATLNDLLLESRKREDRLEAQLGAAEAKWNERFSNWQQKLLDRVKAEGRLLRANIGGDNDGFVIADQQSPNRRHGQPSPFSEITAEEDFEGVFDRFDLSAALESEDIEEGINNDQF